jgi:ATP/maltotriose-dependent transcriptional regulator MalT
MREAAGQPCAAVAANRSRHRAEARSLGGASSPSKEEARSIPHPVQRFCHLVLRAAGPSSLIGADDSFVGRAVELDAIAAAADRARAGQASTIFVSGSAGAGKSTLIRRALAACSDFQLLTAAADELASHLAYGVVAQLVPIPEVPSPFAVGLGLLEALSAAQSDGPALLVVEDLHWADDESRVSLVTALRRLGHDHVLALVTSRPDARDVEDGWERFSFEPNCLQVQPTAFTVEEVAELADSLGVPLGRRDAERLRRHTDGHPLYVRTLLRELTPDQLRTVEAELPAPRSLASATLARLAEVSEPARELASALAVLNERASLTVLGQVAGVEGPTGALEELLDTGFVVWTPGEPSTPVAFAHPLYRSAVYDDMSPSRRRRMHLAAAAVSEPDRALTHRFAASDQPDADLAAALDRAGAEARAAGRRGSAAQYYAWSSEMSPDREDADRRLLDAAQNLLDDNRTTAVLALAPRLEVCGPSPRRDITLGILAWLRGDADLADRLLSDGASAAEAAGDIELAADAFVTLGSMYTARTRGADAVDAASRVLQLVPPGSELQRIAWSVHAMGVGQSQGAARGIDDLMRNLPDRFGGATEGRAAATLHMSSGTLHYFATRITGAAVELRAAIEMARRGAVPDNLVRAHLYLAQALYMLGDWDLSVVNARVATALINEDPHPWAEAQAHASAAVVPAGRGDWSVAQRHVDAALAAARVVNTAEAHFTARIAAAAMHRARGDHAGIVEQLGPLPGTNDGAAIDQFSSLSWWHTLIAALIATGELATAAEQIEGYAERAQERGIDNRARVADLRGRLAASREDAAGATRAFREALSLIGPDDPLLVRVGVHHEFGRLLRATGDRAGATSQLRAARSLLEPVGATPYLAEVDAVLQELGVAAGAGRESPLALTEREQDVVTLVAKGMTNREVAAELYVSQKAVEYHLRNVFGKLGITSRRELRGRTRDSP